MTIYNQFQFTNNAKQKLPTPSLFMGPLEMSGTFILTMDSEVESRIEGSIRVFENEILV